MPKTGTSAPIATGISTMLYANAQNRFWRTVVIVARDRPMAAGTARGSALISVMPAVSMAMSVPVPMAMPTSARARAGASLIPSPTIATVRRRPWRRSTILAFTSGRTSATIRWAGMPT